MDKTCALIRPSPAGHRLKSMYARVCHQNVSRLLHGRLCGIQASIASLRWPYVSLGLSTKCVAGWALHHLLTISVRDDFNFARWDREAREPDAEAVNLSQGHAETFSNGMRLEPFLLE